MYYCCLSKQDLFLRALVSSIGLLVLFNYESMLRTLHILDCISSQNICDLTSVKRIKIQTHNSALNNFAKKISDLTKQMFCLIDPCSSDVKDLIHFGQMDEGEGVTAGVPLARSTNKLFSANFCSKKFQQI